MEEVEQEDNDRGGNQVSCDGQNQMSGIESQLGIVICNTTTHTKQTNSHHSESQDKEGRCHQPEVQLTQFLTHPATGRFGKPVVNRCKEREDVTTKHGVMKVADNPVSIVQMQVCRNSGIWRSRETAHQKHDDAAQDEKHRCRRGDLPLPHRSHP